MGYCTLEGRGKEKKKKGALANRLREQDPQPYKNLQAICDLKLGEAEEGGGLDFSQEEKKKERGGGGVSVTSLRHGTGKGGEGGGHCRA